MGDRYAPLAMEHGRLPILVLHGWSTGPGLPRSIDSDEFELHEMPASTICTIVANWHGMGLLGTAVGAIALVGSLDGWFRWSALPVAAVVCYRLKLAAVGRCIDQDVRKVRA